MAIADNIKRIRKEKGITQKKLGELTNIAEPNIRKYENGKQNPKMETLIKIAKALGVHLKDLVDISIWNEFDETIDVKALAKEVKEIEAIENNPFLMFLKHLGYKVLLEQSSRILIKENIKTIFSETEFENFQNEIKKSVDYQFWLKSQGNKK